LNRDDLQVVLLNLQHLGRARPNAAPLVIELVRRLAEGTGDPEPPAEKLARLAQRDPETAALVGAIIDELLADRPANQAVEPAA
jgi:hypothetical protein